MWRYCKRNEKHPASSDMVHSTGIARKVQVTCHSLPLSVGHDQLTTMEKRRLGACNKSNHFCNRIFRSIFRKSDPHSPYCTDHLSSQPCEHYRGQRTSNIQSEPYILLRVNPLPPTRGSATGTFCICWLNQHRRFSALAIREVVG